MSARSTFPFEFLTKFRIISFTFSLTSIITRKWSPTINTCKLLIKKQILHIRILDEYYNTSARSIFVKWSPLPGPLYGVLRGYRIIYKNLNDSQSEDQSITVDADTLSSEIRELEIDSKYKIRVLAFTVADGNASLPVVVSTDSKILPRKLLRRNL